MSILFITSTTEDYLSDSILHGLRSIYGNSCVDYPKCEIMYKNCADSIRDQVRGNGFTLYSGLLDDIIIDRYGIEHKVQSGNYNLIVFSDIQRQFGWFTQFRPWLNSKNTIILDGADTSQPYPSRGLWWRNPYYWFLPKANKDFMYYKREWTEDTSFSIFRFVMPAYIRKLLPQSNSLRKISFSIPQEKIISELPLKRKDFSKHIVDVEVANAVPGSCITYAFGNEKDYYEDLQQSRFGITMKRAGWDCLRHYEIAANGAVPCFRDLERKPKSCAPHGLSKKNCISYTCASDLLNRIKKITQHEYEDLQLNALDWVKEKTTVKQASEIILNF